MQGPLTNASEQQVPRLRGFYGHAITYGAVNLGLMVVNFVGSGDGIWFVYPLLGWGIGLACHAATVFVMPRWSRHAWEQDRTQELTRREDPW